jgi:hypothetical protein
MGSNGIKPNKLVMAWKNCQFQIYGPNIVKEWKWSGLLFKYCERIKMVRIHFLDEAREQLINWLIFRCWSNGWKSDWGSNKISYCLLAFNPLLGGMVPSAKHTIFFLSWQNRALYPTTIASPKIKFDHIFLFFFKSLTTVKSLQCHNADGGHI